MQEPTPSDHTLTLRGWFRLIAVGLVLVVLVGVARLVSIEWLQYEQSTLARQSVQKLRVTLVAAEMLSRERGPMNGVLGDLSPGGDPQLREQLRQARLITDLAFEAYERALAASTSGALWTARHHLAQRDMEALRQALQQVRDQVDQLSQRGPDRSSEDILACVQAMVDLVPRLAPAMTLFADEAQQADPALAPSVWGARMASELRENAGLLGSLFTPALTRQLPFTVAEQERIDQAKGRIDELRHLMVLRMGTGLASDAIQQAHSEMMQRFFGRASELLAEVEEAGRTDGLYGMSPAQFAARYVPDMDAIVALRDAQLNEAEQISVASRNGSKRSLAWLAALTAIVMALVLTMLNLIRQRIVHPLIQVAEALHEMGRGNLHPVLPQPRANDEIAAVIGGIEALRQQSQARVDLERERDKLIDTLREQSSTDFLTGLPNRRAFYEAAAAEMARARRHDFGAVVLLMDVDHFKRVNDTLGHTVGDLALAAVAGVLHRGMRQGDLVARLGGEEFVALLSHCSLEAGLNFAERLREAIESEAIDVGEGQAPLKVTVSIGLADSASHDHDLDALIERADEAMYRAKQGGRNQTVWSQQAA